MEQRDIEIFLTLADELHFGRAAERLHVSTARVSQTIKKLERRIGAPLFERTSRRVELTSIGRRLDNELRPAYKQLQDAIDGAVAAGRGFGGTLRVGFIGAPVHQPLRSTRRRLRAHSRRPALRAAVPLAVRHRDRQDPSLRPGRRHPGRSPYDLGSRP